MLSIFNLYLRRRRAWSRRSNSNPLPQIDPMAMLDLEKELESISCALPATEELSPKTPPSASRSEQLTPPTNSHVALSDSNGWNSFAELLKTSSKSVNLSATSFNYDSTLKTRGEMSSVRSKRSAVGPSCAGTGKRKSSGEAMSTDEIAVALLSKFA